MTYTEHHDMICALLDTVAEIIQDFEHSVIQERPGYYNCRLASIIDALEEARAYYDELE